MRKVILQEWVTLNGLAAGPNGSVDFVPASTRGDRSFSQAQFAFLDTIDTILLGRVLESGRPLFSDKGTSINMKLQNARTFDRGAVSLDYTHEQ